MYCARCGAASVEGARYCSSCGAPLGPVSLGANAQTAQQQTPVPKPVGEQPPASTTTQRRAPAVSPQEPPSAAGIERSYAYKREPVLHALVHILIAAGWVAYVYLALPRVWEWVADGTMPFSSSWIAPYLDLIAWGPAGLLVLTGLVTHPLIWALGVAEVALSEKGVIFRARSGQEKTVIGPVTVIARTRTGLRISGRDPQGQWVSKRVSRGDLGRRRFREFRSDIERLFAS